MLPDGPEIESFLHDHEEGPPPPRYNTISLLRTVNCELRVVILFRGGECFRVTKYCDAKSVAWFLSPGGVFEGIDPID